MYIGEKNMGYKKGKKELGIYYAKTLVSIAEEISAKNAGKEKAGIQKIFSVLQRRGGTVSKNMTYLVTHWIYRLSLFTPWDDEELWAVDMAKEVFSCPMTLPTCRRKNIFIHRISAILHRDQCTIYIFIRFCQSVTLQ